MRRMCVFIRAYRLAAGQEVGEDEAVALYDLTGLYLHGTAKHRPLVAEGVEHAVLAAGVDARGQVGEQCGVERAPGERAVEALGVDTSEFRAQAGADHVAPESAGIEAPEREQRRETRAGKLLLAVGADVLEEQVAEGHVRYAFGSRARDQRAHARFVLGIGAGVRERHAPERHAGRLGLGLQQLRAHAVHGDAIKALVHRGDEADDVVAIRRAQHVQRPGAVLAAGPGEQEPGFCHRAGTGHHVGCSVRYIQPAIAPAATYSTIPPRNHHAASTAGMGRTTYETPQYRVK